MVRKLYQTGNWFSLARYLSPVLVGLWPKPKYKIGPNIWQQCDVAMSIWWMLREFEGWDHHGYFLDTAGKVFPN